MAASLSMTEAEFWRTTPRYFAMRKRAWDEAQHVAWEHARFISFHAIKSDPKDKIRRLTDIVRFPWESEPVQIPFDHESADKFSDEADEFLKKINPAAYEAYMAGKNPKK